MLVTGNDGLDPTGEYIVFVHMNRADQSVTRHAAASRAAYETLYAAFASQPQGIKASHSGVLNLLRTELRLDESFAQEVETRYSGSGGGKRTRGGGGSGGSSGGDGESGEAEVPAIQIAWKEVCFDILV